MTFNIYNTLILLGIIQGFIFVVAVLLSKKYRSRSIYFLVAVILGLTYNNLQYYLPNFGIISFEKMFSSIWLPLASLIPVLIYFYVILFLFPDKKMLVKEKLLYVPFLIFLLFSITFKIAAAIAYKNDSFYAFFSFIGDFHEIFSVLFSLVLIILLLIRINQYEKRYKNFDIKTIDYKLIWLKTILWMLFCTNIFWAVLAYRNNILRLNDFKLFYALWISYSVVIYVLGHLGIYKFGIIEERKQIRAHYKNKNHTIKQSKNEHITALENLLIKEKAFLDSNLTLESVAEKLQLSTSYLSRTINAELKTSFTEYLNKLRIDEAKQYLNNPNFSNYTILAIGLEAGFNSKSAFFNVFKKVTGSTPLDYKNIQLDK